MACREHILDFQDVGFNVGTNYKTKNLVNKEIRLNKRRLKTRVRTSLLDSEYKLRSVPLIQLAGMRKLSTLKSGACIF